MTSHSDEPAFEARLDLVHEHVLELQARIVALETELHGRGRVATVTALAPAPQAAPPHELGGSIAASEPAASFPAYAPTAQAHAADGGDSQGPVRLLAVAGGAALLLGLAFFVGYAIEQDWLAPGVRFVLAAIASALLTVVAWPIARRGYESVAGAIGGAGLGGWFAAWLVARHAHDLVSVPQTFAALAVGAAACLLIADRLRLRLMAGLATMAACATPVLVASGGDRLHELMIYQLLVIVGLVILDVRQRWPELPTIGLLATWALGAAWAQDQLGTETNGAFVLWSVVLLAVSAGSAWRLLVTTSETLEQHHAYLRLMIGGVATWVASAAAFGLGAPPFAAATALLALWHVGLAVFLHRREAKVSAVFLGFGWVQAFVVGPMILHEAMIGWAWIAMSVAATVLAWSGLQRLRDPMILIPSLAAIAWAIAQDAPWSLLVGLSAAVVPLGASLWPRAEQTYEQPLPWMALPATLMWTVVVLALGPSAAITQFTWALVPVGLLLVWACARPSRQAVVVATIHLGLALFGALAVAVDTHALELDGTGNPGASGSLGALLILLAGCGVAMIARVRRLTEQADQAPNITAIGLMIAGSVGLTLVLGIAVITGASASLGQVGDSLAVAVVGLGLIVAGLRMHDSAWRQAGLAGLAIAAAKIVLFDLAGAAVGWRALSFVGLGAILIAGSFAYSRAYRRACVPAAALE